MNREKLRNILKVLSPNEVNFVPFDNEVKKLKEKLTETVTIKTLEDVSVQLERFKKRIDFTPLTEAFDSLKEDIAVQNTDLLEILDAKQTELGNLIKENDANSAQQIAQLQTEVAILSARKIEIPDFGKQIKETEKKLMAVIDTAKTLDTLEDEKEKEATQEQFAVMDKEFKKLRTDVTRRGGSMYPSFHEEYPTDTTIGLTSYIFRHTIGYITIGGARLSKLAGDYTQSGDYGITLTTADPQNLPINNYF